ncbi:hypothetical protein GGX14DRAFT_398547 [Mycena pura]|uniref:Uncharacterized protein n=1 Tax=Mycena pura TaxID=153505 RepID=A0AAD6VA81_9AGAR|nr:hypothetical protein GGX14DRAFT_398547 [Mycena pura]
MSAAALWAAHPTSHLRPPTTRQSPTQPASLPSAVSAWNPVASLLLTASACRLPPAAHRSPSPLAPAACSLPAPPPAFQAGAQTSGRRVGRGTQSVCLQFHHPPPDVRRPLHPARRSPPPLAARAPCTLRPRRARELAGGGSGVEHRVSAAHRSPPAPHSASQAGRQTSRRRAGGANGSEVEWEGQTVRGGSGVWGGGVAGGHSASHIQPAARAAGVNPTATRLQADRAGGRRWKGGGYDIPESHWQAREWDSGPSKWDSGHQNGTGGVPVPPFSLLLNSWNVFVVYVARADPPTKFKPNYYAAMLTPPLSAQNKSWLCWRSHEKLSFGGYYFEGEGLICS